MFVILNKIRVFTSSNTYINLSHAMSTNLLKPPSCVRNMTELDVTQFEKEIKIPCVSIRDLKISSVLPYLKKFLLKVNNLKPVQVIDGNSTILLNPEAVTSWDDITLEHKDILAQLSITEKDLYFKNHKLSYENFTAEDILKSVLPIDKDGSSSYTKVGHIVHVNLREYLLPYKKIIGQVLLDKVPGCRTVVNKLNIIDNTYRNFEMETLCGEPDFMVKVKHNGCLFEFDFSTVYWNSRLCTEHERIVNLLKSGDVLFDVFAGVGPFSLPAAKKKCLVYANDLNPESFKWLNHNARINKIGPTYLKTFNKDGRDFILQDLKEELLKHISNKNVHITMNLPALAVQFLDSFLGLFSESELSEVKRPPLVHVYCFAKGENCREIAKQLVFDSLDRDISDKITEIFKVRTVSSFKEMMRITFKLDAELLICKKRKSEFHEEINFVPKKNCSNELQEIS